MNCCQCQRNLPFSVICSCSSIYCLWRGNIAWKFSSILKYSLQSHHTFLEKCFLCTTGIVMYITCTNLQSQILRIVFLTWFTIVYHNQVKSNVWQFLLIIWRRVTIMNKLVPILFMIHYTLSVYSRKPGIHILTVLHA